MAVKKICCQIEIGSKPFPFFYQTKFNVEQFSVVLPFFDKKGSKNPDPVLEHWKNGNPDPAKSLDP